MKAKLNGKEIIHISLHLDVTQTLRDSILTFFVRQSETILGLLT